MERDLFHRLGSAITLEPEVFEEIAEDREATAQAGFVVLLAGLCSGLGTLLAGRGMGHLLGDSVIAMMGWLVSSWFTYAVGVIIFRGQTNYGALLRVVGLAHAPLILRVFRFIPICGPFLWPVTGAWMLFAIIVGIRAALGFSTIRALATLMLGSMLAQCFLGRIAALFGLVPHAFYGFGF
jgi:hypothetical protein